MNNYISSFLKLFDYSASIIFYKNRISHILNIDIQEVDKLYKELQNSEFMKKMLIGSGMKKGFYDFSMLSVLRAPSMYVICRLLRPTKIIETGVCDGFSSAFILYALSENNFGNLYSIDLPNQPGHEISHDRAAGWIIPNELKTRWELILGSSRERLPSLLQKLNKIDIFYHDSDHSYENMMFEFNSAYDYLNKPGFILADDITENNAFSHFCNTHHYKHIELFKLGVIKNEM